MKDVASGEIIDSNLDAAPLTFIVGKGQIIPGLESEIKNLSQGDSANVEVSAKDGYGEYDEAAVQSLPKEQFAGLEMTEGMTLYGQGEDGGTVQVIVKEIGEESVIIDFNHPLAGKTLMFSVTVNNVRDASAEEVMTGIPAENKQEDDECCGTGGGTGCGCH